MTQQPKTAATSLVSFQERFEGAIKDAEETIRIFNSGIKLNETKRKNLVEEIHNADIKRNAIVDQIRQIRGTSSSAEAERAVRELQQKVAGIDERITKLEHEKYDVDQKTKKYNEYIRQAGNIISENQPKVTLFRGLIDGTNELTKDKDRKDFQAILYKEQKDFPDAKIMTPLTGVYAGNGDEVNPVFHPKFVQDFAARNHRRGMAGTLYAFNMQDKYTKQSWCGAYSPDTGIACIGNRVSPSLNNDHENYHFLSKVRNAEQAGKIKPGLGITPALERYEREVEKLKQTLQPGTIKKLQDSFYGSYFVTSRPEEFMCRFYGIRKEGAEKEVIPGKEYEDFLDIIKKDPAGADFLKKLDMENKELTATIDNLGDIGDKVRQGMAFKPNVGNKWSWIFKKKNTVEAETGGDEGAELLRKMQENLKKIDGEVVEEEVAATVEKKLSPAEEQAQERLRQLEERKQAARVKLEEDYLKEITVKEPEPEPKVDREAEVRRQEQIRHEEEIKRQAELKKQLEISTPVWARNNDEE